MSHLSRDHNPSAKGTATMKLTTVTNVSVDGVTQGHRRIDAGTRREAGAPDEDGGGGFERFGWAPPLLDDGASTFISQAFQRADAFLFGRRTYEIFAGSLSRPGSDGGPFYGISTLSWSSGLAA
jgi:hypothetical protein